MICHNCIDPDYCQLEHPFACSRKCPTCHGSGNASFEWEEKIDVPDGYSIFRIVPEENIVMLTRNIDTMGAHAILTRPYPHKPGGIIDVVCDACGGDGEKIKTLYDCDRCKECLIQEGSRVCPKDELIICPKCKGKPEAKVEVEKVTVKDNKFIITVREV
jgi:hypothetical protein